MADLPGTTWVRFFIWMGLGLIIYFAYGRSHSRLRKGEVVNPEAELPGARSARGFRPAGGGHALGGSVSRGGGRMSRSVVVAALMALGLFAPSLAEAADELSDLRPARRPPLRDDRAARLRGRHRGRALPGHGLPHPRRDGRRVDARRSSSSTASGSASASEWIGPATRFTSGYGHVRMRLPAHRRPERRAHRLRARRAPRRAGRPEAARAGAGARSTCACRRTPS